MIDQNVTLTQWLQKYWDSSFLGLKQSTNNVAIKYTNNKLHVSYSNERKYNKYNSVWIKSYVSNGLGICNA